MRKKTRPKLDNKIFRRTAAHSKKINIDLKFFVEVLDYEIRTLFYQGRQDRLYDPCA